MSVACLRHNLSDPDTYVRSRAPDNGRKNRKMFARGPDMSSTPRTPNGRPEPSAELTTLPPVIGINLGNSYASIAVFTKVRHRHSLFFFYGC